DGHPGRPVGPGRVDPLLCGLLCDLLHRRPDRPEEARRLKVPASSCYALRRGACEHRGAALWSGKVKVDSKKQQLGVLTSVGMAQGRVLIGPLSDGRGVRGLWCFVVA